jgi:glycosyltransferase involved in cell wall biosynthesis
MAPRTYDGIGQSFLEAMSYGIKVIASDSPTMNEYIRHNHNGYLYRLSAPEPLALTNLPAMCAQAANDVADSHRAWQLCEQQILAYLASDGRKSTSINWRLRGLLRS